MKRLYDIPTLCLQYAFMVSHIGRKNEIAIDQGDKKKKKKIKNKTQFSINNGSKDVITILFIAYLVYDLRRMSRRELSNGSQ